MKVEEDFPMRNWIVAAVVGVMSVSAHATTLAAGPIKLSAGIDAACEAIAAAPAAAPQVMLVDVPTIDASAARSLLDAINDRREAKGTVMAVCTSKTAPTREGAAIVALACDAVVLVRGVSLVGAETAWCKSASSRERFGSDLARLGRIDPKLAARFLDSTADLTWSEGVGFNPPAATGRKVASAGQPIACNAGLLTELGIEAKEVDSTDAALAMLAEGRVKPRKLMATAKVPTKPAAPKAQPAGADAKVAEKVAEYGAALVELKGLLREFNEYYKGDKGIWTGPNEGLKWVWEDQSDHTQHKDTKMTCQRLQRDIKTKMSTLESCLKTVERVVKDESDPDLARMKANVTALDGLRAAFERNKVSNYETFYSRVMALK